MVRKVIRLQMQTRLAQKTFLLRSLFLWDENNWILQVMKNKIFGILCCLRLKEDRESRIRNTEKMWV